MRTHTYTCLWLSFSISPCSQFVVNERSLWLLLKSPPPWSFFVFFFYSVFIAILCATHTQTRRRTVYVVHPNFCLSSSYVCASTFPSFLNFLRPIVPFIVYCWPCIFTAYRQLPPDLAPLLSFSIYLRICRYICECNRCLISAFTHFLFFLFSNQRLSLSPTCPVPLLAHRPALSKSHPSFFYFSAFWQ